MIKVIAMSLLMLSLPAMAGLKFKTGDCIVMRGQLDGLIVDADESNKEYPYIAIFKAPRPPLLKVKKEAESLLEKRSCDEMDKSVLRAVRSQLGLE